MAHPPTEDEASAGQLHVARDRPGPRSRRLRGVREASKGRRGVAERLSRVGQRLGVCVVVMHCIPGEVADHIGRVGAQDAVGDPLSDRAHVVHGVRSRRQVEPPAGVVWHRAGVVQRVPSDRIGSSPQAWRSTELLLEPGQVADLPQQWVHGRQQRADHLLVAEVGDELQCALAAVQHPTGESSAAGVSEPMVGPPPFIPRASVV